MVRYLRIKGPGFHPPYHAQSFATIGLEGVFGAVSCFYSLKIRWFTHKR